jgi:hypothetical protein
LARYQQTNDLFGKMQGVDDVHRVDQQTTLNRPPPLVDAQSESSVNAPQCCRAGHHNGTAHGMNTARLNMAGYQ